MSPRAPAPRLAGRVRSLAGVLILAFPLAPATQPVQARESYIVGVAEQDALPFLAVSSKSGDPEGYIPALLRAFARAAGVDFTFVALSDRRLAVELGRAEVDFALPLPASTAVAGEGVVLADFVEGVLVPPTLRGGPLNALGTLAHTRATSPPAAISDAAGAGLTVFQPPTVLATIMMGAYGRANALYGNVPVLRARLRAELDLDGFLVFDPSLPNRRLSYRLVAADRADVLDALRGWLARDRDAVAALRADHGLGGKDARWSGMR